MIVTKGISRTKLTAVINAPYTLQILFRVHRTAIPVRAPEGFAETVDKRVFGGVDFKPLAEFLVGGADSLWAVDGELVGDGEVQREVEEGVHLSAFGGEFLLDGGFRVFQQLVVFRVVHDEVCGDGFGTIEDFTSAVFAPRFAEELADLVT